MNWRHTVLLLSALCALPAAAADIRITVPYTSFTMSNGLTVILHEDHTTPTVAVTIWYRVGSGRERPGRTGFAHLFEHIMYEGSAHVPEGKYDEWLEGAGGDNNGSTSPDRTNYWIAAPKNALELALFVESDRMGYLLPAMSPATVDGQRDVVKNERRQSYENQPYGFASLVIDENLYPPAHPYHWQTIGSMQDLSAASYQDVVEFFKTYYRPNNATLCVAGDIDPAQARAMVEKWFGDVSGGPAVPPMDKPAVILTEEKRLFFEDKVQLPRLFMVWHSPAMYTPGDAELDVLANVLAGGKNSRLYRRLVYELQIAQDVMAYQASAQLGSSFQIVATARAGHSLAELEKVIQEEIDRLKSTPPTRRELDRAVNQFEASYLGRLEMVGGFGGKSDQLCAYSVATGNPDFFNEDLTRYRALDPTDIQAAALSYLRNNSRVVLSIVPPGKKELASGSGREVHPK